MTIYQIISAAIDLIFGIIVLYSLHTITLKLKKIMNKEEQLAADIQEIRDANTAIAARIQTLIDAEADNIAQSSLDTLKSVADDLTKLGALPAAPAAGGSGETAAQ